MTASSGDNFFLPCQRKWLSTIRSPDRSRIGSVQQLQILSGVRPEDHRQGTGGQPGGQLSPEEQKAATISTGFEDPPQSSNRPLKAGVKKYLDYLNGLKTLETSRAMARCRSPRPALQYRIGWNDHIPTLLVNLTQGGIGLPYRDYYLSYEQGAGGRTPRPYRNIFPT